MILTVLAARTVGRPVKLILTRPEMFTGVGHRPDTHQTIALGARRDGQLVAIDHEATSTVAILNVTVSPTAPIITSGTNQVNAFVGGSVTFAPVAASGTQPFSYQWYDKSGNALSDGAKYAGSTTAS